MMANQMNWFVLSPKTVMYMIVTALVIVMFYTVRPPSSFPLGLACFSGGSGTFVSCAGFANDDGGKGVGKPNIDLVGEAPTHAYGLSMASVPPLLNGGREQAQPDTEAASIIAKAGLVKSKQQALQAEADHPESSMSEDGLPFLNHHPHTLAFYL